jgi:hypothetical protein
VSTPITTHSIDTLLVGSAGSVQTLVDIHASVERLVKHFAAFAVVGPTVAIDGQVLTIGTRDAIAFERAVDIPAPEVLPAIIGTDLTLIDVFA